jgi:lipopolysaccharide biosynthesis glycosyltransferase
MSGKYHLLLSTNEAYMEQTVVCMSSVLRSNQEKRLQFHILHSEIENAILDQVRKWMKTESDLAELSFYRIHSEDYFFPVKPGDIISCETYFRILAPELLPQDLNKILYMDGDTICLGDLKELWETDIEGYAAASREVAVPEYRKQNLGIGERDFYFQAGVMLLNLQWWREHHITEEILNFIGQHPNILPRWDQDALNAVLSGKVKKIHPKWNTCLDVLPPEQWEQVKPLIVHYTGSQLFKPWFKNSVSEYQKLYLEYRKETPYDSRKLEICKSSRFSFPIHLVPQESRIVLYGAGQYGKAYYLQNQRCHFCEIISWVDKGYGKNIYGRQILPPITLLGMDYDFILVAVSAQYMADSIREELQGMGISSDKILWNSPAFPIKVNELKTHADLKQYFQKVNRLIFCGSDEVTMACLSFLDKHSIQKKIAKFLIQETLDGQKEIMGVEMQMLDEFQYSSDPVLLAVNDGFHIGWLMELYDRGCKEISLLSHSCYQQLCELARNEIDQWKRKRLSLKGGAL